VPYISQCSLNSWSSSQHYCQYSIVIGHFL
jgi:hypothetical protein